MKLKKFFGINFTAIALMTIASADIVKADEAVTITPPNAVNVLIVDEEGKEIDGIDVKMNDSSGSSVASWTTGEDNLSISDESGIKSGDSSFKVKAGQIANLKSGETFRRIYRTSDNRGYYSFNTNITVKQNTTTQYEVIYEGAYNTDMVVLPNTYKVYVDDACADNLYDDYLVGSNTNFKLNFKEIAGQIKTYSAETGEHGVSAELDVNDIVAINYFKVYDQATEYAKVRVDFSDLVYDFDSDFNLTYPNGPQINLREEKADGTRTVIYVISGAVINVVEIDDDGYIEIYVEKTTKKVCTQCSTNYVENGKLNRYGYGVETKIVESKYVTANFGSLPKTGMSLMNVAAGNYSFELSNIPAKYDTPDVVSFKATDSSAVQYVKIVLKSNDDSVHTTHVADTGKMYHNEDSHWNLCMGCDKKMNVSTHSLIWIIDKEATETTVGYKHQECSICGYVKDKVTIDKLQPSTTVQEKEPIEDPTEIKTEEKTTNPTEETIEEITEKPAEETMENSTEGDTEETTENLTEGDTEETTERTTEIHTDKIPLADGDSAEEDSEEETTTNGNGNSEESVKKTKDKETGIVLPFIVIVLIIITVAAGGFWFYKKNK